MDDALVFLSGVLAGFAVGSVLVMYAWSNSEDRLKENLKPYMQTICTKDIKTLTKFEVDSFKYVCLEGK